MFTYLCTLGWKMDAEWLVLFKANPKQFLERQKEVKDRGYEKKSQRERGF